jgi:hypothetical protein
LKAVLIACRDIFNMERSAQSDSCNKQRMTRIAIEEPLLTW